MQCLLRRNETNVGFEMWQVLSGLASGRGGWGDREGGWILENVK